MLRWRALSRIQRLVALLTVTGALAGGVSVLAGSDHQDVPLVTTTPAPDRAGPRASTRCSAWATRSSARCCSTSGATRLMD